MSSAMHNSSSGDTMMVMVMVPFVSQIFDWMVLLEQGKTFFYMVMSAAGCYYYLEGGETEHMMMEESQRRGGRKKTSW